VSFRRSLCLALAVFPLVALIGCGDGGAKVTDSQPSGTLKYTTGKPAEGGGRPAPPAPPPIQRVDQ
jgi:hypothetical protein